MSDKQPDKEAVDQAVKFALDTLQGGKDFVMEQAPLFVQELIVRRWVWLTAACFLIPVIGWLIWHVGKNVKAGITAAEADDGPNNAVPFCVGWILWIVSLLWTLIALPLTAYECLKVWFAPRLYLIEYLSALVRK